MGKIVLIIMAVFFTTFGIALMAVLLKSTATGEKAALVLICSVLCFIGLSICAGFIEVADKND